MTLRSTRVVVAAIVAVIALASLGLAVREEPGHTSTIDVSSTFDVRNLPHLAGYADNIFVASVEAIESVEDEHTQYRVSVEETVKGDLDGDIVVSQLGYVDDNVTHVTEGQPLLQVGSTYLLVTNLDTTGTDWQSLIVGPTAAVSVDDDNRRGVVERYRGATARQVYPPGLPPKEKPQE
jgi:hypothetical protein